MVQHLLALTAWVQLNLKHLFCCQLVLFFLFLRHIPGVLFFFSTPPPLGKQNLGCMRKFFTFGPCEKWGCSPNVKNSFAQPKFRLPCTVRKRLLHRLLHPSLHHSHVEATVSFFFINFQKLWSFLCTYMCVYSFLVYVRCLPFDQKVWFKFSKLSSSQ